MFRTRAMLGGLIGGAIGAAIWAAVVYFTEYEVAWIAWGVGALVGYGVAVGNRGASHSATGAGILAVGIAILAIVAGKYAAIQLVLPDTDDIAAAWIASLEDEELVVSYVADEVAGEFEAAGRPVEWPAGVDPNRASTEAEYPPDVWAEAASRWTGFSQEERSSFRGELEDQIQQNAAAAGPEIRATMVEEAFRGSFGGLDILFFGLAVVTAFGVAAGGRKTKEEVAEEYHDAIRRVMIGVMVADQEADDTEIRAIVDIFGQLTGSELTEAAVRAEADQARIEGRDLTTTLQELSPYLSDEGKELAVQAAIMVATADGEFDARERELIEQVAAALGMSQNHLRGTIAEVTRSG